MSKIRNVICIALAAVVVPASVALSVVYFSLWNFGDYLSSIREYLGDPGGDEILYYTAGGFIVTGLLVLIGYLLSLDTGRKRRPALVLYLSFFGLSVQGAALAGASLENAVTNVIAIPGTLLVALVPPLVIFPLEWVFLNLLYWLARGFLRIRLFRMAGFFFHKALLFKPGDTRIREYLGQTLLRAGKIRVAREILVPLMDSGTVSTATLHYLAEGYEREKDWNQAIHYYRNLMERTPEDDSLNEKLIQLFLITEQFDQAIPMVEARTDFDSLKDVLKLEDLYERAGDMDRVRELLSKGAAIEGPPCRKILFEYRRLLKHNEDDQALLQDLADLCWDLDKKAEGSDYLERILSFEPDNRELRRKLLDYYLESSQPNKVEKHIEYLIRQGELSALILKEYAELLIQKEDFDAALEHLSQAKEIYPGEYQFPHILSQLHYDRREYDMAREEMALALRLVPPEKKEQLQILYRKIEGAILNAQIKDLRGMIKNDPKNIELRFELIDKLMANAYMERVTSELDTMLYYHPELKQRVIEHINKLVQKYERNYLLLDYLADMYLRDSEFDKCMDIYERMSVQSLDPREVARSCCRKILKLNPSYIPANKKLGDMAKEEKNWPVMIEHYMLCRDQDPDSIVDCLEDLFDAYLEIGEPEKALEFGVLLVEKQPENASILKKMGTLYMSLGRYEDALSSLKMALEIDENDKECRELLDESENLMKKNQLDIVTRKLKSEPDNSDYREQTGDLLCYFGNFTEAVKHYQRAAQLAPDADLCKAKLAYCLAMRGMLDLAEETMDEVKLSITDSSLQEDLKYYFYETAVQFAKELEPVRALKLFKQIFRVDASYRDVVPMIEKIENLGTIISPYGKKVRSRPKRKS